MKRKRNLGGSTDSIRFGQYPFFGSEEHPDTADAARYRALTSGVFDFGFFADMAGATKAQWDAAVDKKRKELK